MATPKLKTNAQARKIHARRARMSLPEQVRDARDVYVHVSGSPRSVAALLWTFQQGRMDAKVVYQPTRCDGSVHVDGIRSPLTRSYVKALAESFGLEYLELGEVGDVENVTVSGTSLPGSATVAPFVGRSEEDALELLDVAGVRPHPGVVLGAESLCDDAALKRLAKRPQHDFEHSLAAAMVLSSDFPTELLFYGDGQKRVKAGARRATQAKSTKRKPPKQALVSADQERLAAVEAAKNADDVLEAAIRADEHPDYVAWMKRARTAQEGRVVLHVLDEELRGISRAVINSVNPPNDPEYVAPGVAPADHKYIAKKLRPILDDFFAKADALGASLGARARSLYQQRRVALAAWQPLYAKEKAG